MKKTIIGYSRLGREIPLFHSGRGDAAVLIVGGVHAREYITCDLVFKLWREASRNTDCIPCLNPDGRAIARGGSFWSRPKDATFAKSLKYRTWQRVHDVGFRVLLEENP